MKKLLLLLFLISGVVFSYVPSNDRTEGIDYIDSWNTNYVTIQKPLVTNLEQILQQITTPSNPSAGFLKFYSKSGDLLYYKNSSGAESTIASQAFADAKVADAINNGTTTIAPSQNAVFDALALKEDLSNKSTDGTFAANSTTLYPSQSAAKTYADTKVPKTFVLTTTAPITCAGGASCDFSTDRTIAMAAATASIDGYLTAANFTTFNGKLTSPLTTKGDILTRDVSGHIRIPVSGNNGYVLTEDSAEAGGFKWAAATGGITGLTDNCVLRADGTTGVQCGGYSIDDSGFMVGVDGLYFGSTEATLAFDVATSTSKFTRPVFFMTTAQKNAVGTPPDYSQVFDTDIGALQFYLAGWQNVGGGMTTSEFNGAFFSWSVSTTTAQTCLGNEAMTKIEFEVEIEDSANVHDTSTGVVTIPAGKWYCYYGGRIHTEAFTPETTGTCTGRFGTSASANSFYLGQLSLANSISDLDCVIMDNAVKSFEVSDSGVGREIAVWGQLAAADETTLACDTGSTRNRFYGFCYKEL